MTTNTTPATRLQLLTDDQGRVTALELWLDGQNAATWWALPFEDRFQLLDRCRAEVLFLSASTLDTLDLLN